MTKEECAIVTIYTGVAMLEGDDLEYLYRYAEKLMERPVFTHELATLADELKKRAKPDFINLCRWASAQPEIIRCKDCKHRPVTNDAYDCDERDCGLNIEFPDYRCPCQCDDPYYNRLPDDDWFCGNAERREK